MADTNLTPALLLDIHIIKLLNADEQLKQLIDKRIYFSTPADYEVYKKDKAEKVIFPFVNIVPVGGTASVTSNKNIKYREYSMNVYISNDSSRYAIAEQIWTRIERTLDNKKINSTNGNLKYSILFYFPEPLTFRQEAQAEKIRRSFGTFVAQVSTQYT